MQRLSIYQAIWGMEGLSGGDLEADLESVMDKIESAGFDGVGASLLNANRAHRVARSAARRRLGFEAGAFVWGAEDFAAQLGLAEDLGAHHLNVQVLQRCDRVMDAKALLQAIEAEASGATIPVYFETHRGRITNDLLFLCRLLDELPNLKLTGDLSHYPVTHEMLLPVTQPDLVRMSKVLAHCWAFHGRVSASHQVQVSLEAPQHEGWVQQFRTWWREGFENWTHRADPNAELTFMCELGPPHYAITDAGGGELCDRWREANLMKDIAHELWQSVAVAEI